MKTEVRTSLFKLRETNKRLQEEIERLRPPKCVHGLQDGCRAVCGLYLSPPCPSCVALRAELATYKESFEQQLILKEGVSEANDELRVKLAAAEGANRRDHCGVCGQPNWGPVQCCNDQHKAPPVTKETAEYIRRLAAMKARVEDVEGMAKVIGKASLGEAFQPCDMDLFEEHARAVQKYLKGEG